MSYAVRNDGQGWRAVNGPDDVGPDEVFSVEQPVAPNEPTVEAFQLAVQTALDTKARERNYDGILSLCSYADSTNAVFSAEAGAGLLWRDACWAHCYQALADVQNNLRQPPTVAELVAELPAMSWPV